MSGKVPDIAYKHNEVWLKKRRFLLYISFYKGAILFPESFSEFLSSVGAWVEKQKTPSNSGTL